MRTASQSRNARGGKYSRGGLWQPKDSVEGTDEAQADAPPFWEGSVATFQSWLSHNPLRLGIDDHAVSLIQGEISRGNDDASARLRCYMHIVVELSVVPGAPAGLLDVAGARRELHVGLVGGDAGGAAAASACVDLAPPRTEDLAVQTAEAQLPQAEDATSSPIGVDAGRLFSARGSGIAAAKALCIKPPESTPTGPRPKSTPVGAARPPRTITGELSMEALDFAKAANTRESPGLPKGSSPSVTAATSPTVASVSIDTSVPDDTDDAADLAAAEPSDGDTNVAAAKTILADTNEQTSTTAKQPIVADNDADIADNDASGTVETKGAPAPAASSMLERQRLWMEKVRVKRENEMKKKQETEHAETAHVPKKYSNGSKWDKVRSRVFAAKPGTQDPNDASGTAAAATATATRPSGRRSSVSEGQRPRRRKTSGAKSAGGSNGTGKMSLMDACKSLLHNSKRDAMGVGKVAPGVTEGVVEKVASTASKDDAAPATIVVSAAAAHDKGDDKRAGLIGGAIGGGAAHPGSSADAGMSTSASDAADVVAVAGTDKENVLAAVVANPGIGIAAVPQSSRSALGECASSSRSSSVGNIAETADEVPVKYPPRFVTNLDTSKLRLRVEDPSLFDSDTLYKKRDRRAGQSGIALQVGHFDDKSGNEGVASVYFAKEHFPEENDALKWWQANRTRLQRGV